MQDHGEGGHPVKKLWQRFWTWFGKNKTGDDNYGTSYGGAG